MTTLQTKLSNEDRAVPPDPEANEDPDPQSERTDVEDGTGVRSNHADRC